MQIYLSFKSSKQSYSALLMPSTLPDLINTQTPIQHFNILVQNASTFYIIWETEAEKHYLKFPVTSRLPEF